VSGTRLAPLAVVIGLACGCGSSAHGTPSSTDAAQAAAAAVAAQVTAPAVSALALAERPPASAFPTVRGRNLNQLAALGRWTAQVGASTGTFTPGTRRFAFALIGKSNQLIYAPTALYIAASPSAPAQGPFLAPADPMIVAPGYRSVQNVGPGEIRAIYWTDLPLPRAGTFAILALTRSRIGLIASRGIVAVGSSSPIPDVGQHPPDIATDTAATVHGDTALLSTRTPPDDMHAVSLNQALGKRPVMLLFSTPALCTSRICGPVTDVAVSLEREFGSRISFIHEEVYVDNDPTKGLRPQLKAFHLETEPWLFTIDRHRVIAARLEGAFGVRELRDALEAALR
jgi:hypothetical protein